MGQTPLKARAFAPSLSALGYQGKFGTTAPSYVADLFKTTHRRVAFQAHAGLFGVPLAVFVWDKRKKPLMPCCERRARLLLTCGRAVVHHHQPLRGRLCLCLAARAFSPG